MPKYNYPDFDRSEALKSIIGIIVAIGVILFFALSCTSCTVSREYTFEVKTHVTDVSTIVTNVTVNWRIVPNRERYSLFNDANEFKNIYVKQIIKDCVNNTVYNYLPDNESLFTDKLKDSILDEITPFKYGIIRFTIIDITYYKE